MQRRLTIYPEPNQEEPDEEQQYDELEYMAACVEAEAGNQGHKGKRLVACVILNRVDSDCFPDTIEAVINQRNQFEVVANGSIRKVSISEETFRAVKDELNERSNNKILYFREGRYHDFGTPVLKHKDHYFSGR